MQQRHQPVLHGRAHQDGPVDSLREQLFKPHPHRRISTGMPGEQAALRVRGGGLPVHSSV